jgi:hypothetical protein
MRTKQATCLLFVVGWWWLLFICLGLLREAAQP